MAILKQLRIATRKSPLACRQADIVKNQLERHYPFLQIAVIPFMTAGDRHVDSTLTGLGGKGLFVKELEIALLNGQADIAVHSMKDVPMELEKGLLLTAICQREDPRDVLISSSGELLRQLSAGSKIGSSSLRRQSQLLALRPDLQVCVLRGNVGTRLNRLAAGEYDAIILAAVGLIRLGKTACISEYLTTDSFLPAPGQGALGIECSANDSEIQALIAVLNHNQTYQCVMAERALSRQLGGSCQVPIAAYAECLGNQIRLQGLVAKPNGGLLIKAEKYGAMDAAEALGIAVAKALMDRGAKRILQELV